MIQQIYTGNSLRNFSYLISSDQGYYCVDPFDAQQIIPHLKRPLLAIINTHEHWDHIQGNQELVEHSQCEVWTHFDAQNKIPNVSRVLVKGERIELTADSYMEVLDTPGHTFSHLCLLFVKNDEPWAVITGDTLFNAGVGNCHNGGNPEVLYETISRQFQNLPDQVKVYPGHDYLQNNLNFTLDREPHNQDAKNLKRECNEFTQRGAFRITDMGEERKINTFLRLKSLEIIENLKGDTSSDKQVFLRLRELRNQW